MSGTEATLAPTVVTARAPTPPPPLQWAEISVGGKRFNTWTSISVSREITKMATEFDLGVTEAEAGALFPSSEEVWQIPVFSPCEIRLRGELVLTGYVDVAYPSYTGRTKTVRIVGRSKTCDLVDCSSELPTEFRASTLSAIARAVCAPFGIQVVDQAPIGEPFPLAAMEPTETAFQFIERLCRLRGVLATDDPQGRLVLTRAGDKKAAGALWQGDNILACRVRHNVSKRFSKYLFKGQAPTSAAVSYPGLAGEPEGPLQQPNGGAQTAVLGTATDPNVPRYRPRIFVAEQALTGAGARERALWQASHAAGQSTKALITVRGWQQEDGRLWAINEVIPVLSPWARLDHDLLISGVTFTIDSEEGRVTELELGPVGGFTPEPVKVKRQKGASGSGGGGNAWLDLGR